MGQRRHKIIQQLRPDWKVTTVDPVGGDLPEISLSEAIRYEIAFIATPPILHGHYLAAFIHAILPVFIEKPICLPGELNTAQAFYAGANVPVMVGHNLLWHKGFQQFQEQVKKAGQIIHYSARFENLLTEWGRANKDSYSRYRGQGGGVLLDCLQDIDLALEITGGLEPTYYYQMVEGNPITVDSEYLAIVNGVQPGSGIHATMMFDYLTLPRRRKHAVHGSEERIEWVEDRGPELDQSYVDETEAFIKWVETGHKPKLVPDPFRALEFVRKIYAL